MDDFFKAFDFSDKQEDKKDNPVKQNPDIADNDSKKIDEEDSLLRSIISEDFEDIDSLELNEVELEDDFLGEQVSYSEKDSETTKEFYKELAEKQEFNELENRILESLTLLKDVPYYEKVLHHFGYILEGAFYDSSLSYNFQMAYSDYKEITERWGGEINYVEMMKFVIKKLNEK